MFRGCSLFQQPLLRESVTQQGVAAGLLITYPKLPCSPYSPAWKGSAMIRGVLTKMLAMAMVVVAPRRCLGGGQVTEIIVSLLVAAGIDPVTHVRVQHDAEVEDHQPDEKDNNTGDID